MCCCRQTYVVIVYAVTHLGVNKTANSLHMAFAKAFPWMKVFGSVIRILLSVVGKEQLDNSITLAQVMSLRRFDVNDYHN